MWSRQWSTQGARRAHVWGLEGEAHPKTSWSTRREERRWLSSRSSRWSGGDECSDRRRSGGSGGRAPSCAQNPALGLGAMGSGFEQERRERFAWWHFVVITFKQHVLAEKQLARITRSCRKHVQRYFFTISMREMVSSKPTAKAILFGSFR
jgi:hypothetical protein